MGKCWNFVPEDRPCFSELIQLASAMLQGHACHSSFLCFVKYSNPYFYKELHIPNLLLNFYMHFIVQPFLESIKCLLNLTTKSKQVLAFVYCSKLTTYSF